MSFSQEVKQELSKLNNLANKEEVKYEFMGYLASNNIFIDSRIVRYSTESDYNIDRFAKLARNVGIENFKIDISGKVFFVELKKKDIEFIKEFDYENTKIDLFKSYVRGIFMGSGSINNPEKKYHLEFSTKNDTDSINIVSLMRIIDINLKNKKTVVYAKEGEEISKFLAFIGANKSVLKFEEIRVQKSMNNKVNRIVNCETANLNKVLNASVEQINAIQKLKDKGEFEKLDDSLKEIANLRIENPDMSLIELGKKLVNPIGKSGVNYRLKKIMEIAKED